jgi:arylsulfatase A-like enzyme
MSETGSRRLNWIPPLAHPLVLVMLVTLVVRGVGLARHTFGADINGQPMVLMPWVYFPATFDYHYGVIMAGSAGLLLAWRLAPRARRGLVALGGIAAGLVMLLGQADFLMLRLAGRRMSPEVLATYGNRGSVTAEIWAPLRADAWHSLWALGLVAVGWLLLWGIVRWSWRQNSTPPWSGPWWVALVGGAVYLWAVPIRYEVMSVTMRPPEVVWAHVWWGGEQNPVEADRRDRVAAVRGMLVAAEDVSWQDDAYPLVRSLPSGAMEGGPPDIIVLVVESLRGATVGFISGETPSPTPELDLLARSGVAFPRFISNGFPSSEGFFALHTGLLPHPTKTATAALAEHHFDALPERLKRLGYRRTALWGGNAVMDNQLAWAQRWYDEVDYEERVNRWRFKQSRTDGETIDALIGHVARGDRENPEQPQFFYVATAGMHEPFTSVVGPTKNALANRDGALRYDATTMGDREVNYRARLREFDDALGRLRIFLESRERRDRTVLLICGDHSVLLNEAVDLRMRTYPVDGFVWTGAVMQGASSLIGPARVADFPASQIDVMPTLLRLAGDEGATAAMGQDLLAGGEAIRRQAVAVREGGFRLDRANGTLFVSAENPADWTDESGVSSESSSEARKLHEAVWGWAWLLERDQVWPRSDEKEQRR